MAPSLQPFIKAYPGWTYSGGTIMFFPQCEVGGLVANPLPIIAWNWNFGDGTGTHTLTATPTYTFPAVTTLTAYTVTVTVTLADETTATSQNLTVYVDSVTNALPALTDNTNLVVSVLIYNSATGANTVLNRVPTVGCTLSLVTPVIDTMIDQSPSGFTFSILDYGSSTATEKSLIAQGMYVVAVRGQEIIASGVIRRSTLNTQSGFGTTTRLKLWDIECDSDLLKLSNYTLPQSYLAYFNPTLNLSPGHTADILLLGIPAPTSGHTWEGKIDFNDTPINFQLYNTTPSSQTSSVYDLLTSLQQSTNYDMVARPDYMLYPYATFDGTSVINTVPATYTSRGYEATTVLQDGSILVIGGYTGTVYLKDTWRSTDKGRHWVQQSATASWAGRNGHTANTLPDGSVVIMGGWTASGAVNDVWRSTDMGVTWTQQTASAGWTARNDQASVVAADGTLVLMGGSDNSHVNQKDVWKSTDKGATWTQQTAAASWAIRSGHAAVANANGIYLMGGYGASFYHDVWLSTDNGATWTSKTAAAGWSARQYPGVISNGLTLVLMGGLTSPSAQVNDVWTSSDGITWTEVNTGAAWTTRGDSGVQLVGSTIVLTGGFASGPVLYTDSWYSQDNGVSWSASYVPVSWTASQFVGGWVLIPAAKGSPGVITWGIVTANDTTTITYTAVNPSAAPTTSGRFLIYNGAVVDFAPNLTTTTTLASYNVNQQIFNFTTNDDKRKLSTKIIATGTDVNGNSIAVGMSAVHAYNVQRQYFNNATPVTKLSEGYIYKNNYGSGIPVISVYTSLTETVAGFSGTYDVQTNHITYYPVGSIVTPSNYPSGNHWPTLITPGTPYYVVANDGNSKFQLSATPPGSPGTPIAIAGYLGNPTAVQDGGLIIDNSSEILPLGSLTNTPIALSATSMPGGLSAIQVYYPYTTSIASATFALPLSSTPNTLTYVSVTSQGSGVYIVSNSTIGNLNPCGANPVVWLYGWGYSIPIGSNMAVAAFPQSPGGSGTTTAATTANITSQGTDSNGTQYTVVPLTGFLTSDFSGQGYLLNSKLFVLDNTQLGTNAVLVGEEAITVTGTGTDTLYGNYILFTVLNRIISPTLNVYPHGVGALAARTNYTEVSPETGSAVANYGIIVQKQAVSTTANYGDLESYATTLLLGFGGVFYQMANCVGHMTMLNIPVIQPTPGEISRNRYPVIGDALSITQYTGGAAQVFEIIGVTSDFDQGLITLQLGDYEKNVFISMMSNTRALTGKLT